MTSPIQPYQGSYLTPSFATATVADVMRPGVVWGVVSDLDLARAAYTGIEPFGPQTSPPPSR